MTTTSPSQGIPRVIGTFISILFRDFGTILDDVFDGTVQILNSQGLAPANAVGILFGLPNVTGVFLTRSADGVITARLGDSVGAGANGATIEAAALGAFGAIPAGVPAVGLTLLSGQTQASVGAAGGASALPATPAGYMIWNIGGVTRVVPFYLP